MPDTLPGAHAASEALPCRNRSLRQLRPQHGVKGQQSTAGHITGWNSLLRVVESLGLYLPLRLQNVETTIIADA